MPGQIYEGKDPYVDPGTEPVDHTGGEPDDDLDTPVEVEVEEVDDDLPKEGDADYTPPDEPVELPVEAQNALNFYEYVNTKDGAVDFMIEAGLGLGKSIDELEAFFMGKPVEPAVEEDDPDDERVMTVKEWKAEQAKLRGELDARDQEKELQQAAARVREAATAGLTALKIGDEVLTEKQRIVVANMADQYLDVDSQYDVQAVEAAIAKGFADFTEAMGFTTEGKKVVKRKVVPKGLKGSTGGAVEAEEPQGLEDAFKRARKQLRDLGEL